MKRLANKKWRLRTNTVMLSRELLKECSFFIKGASRFIGHCEERSDEAISKRLIFNRKIASLRSQ
jgi:hypothetical protein